MKRALAEARKGLGRVHPNPLVGAVLVKKDKVIGSGAHEMFGKAHAEVNAILSSKIDPAGATLYVTLEPCRHFGKTPPCTNFILKHGIKKVVIASRDLNPVVAGKGIQALKKAGVRVVTGVMEKEALELNKDYFHWIKRKMPYAVVKVAQSLDGKISTAGGQSRWITAKASRIFGHRLRAESDATLVGVETVLKDDPLLRRAPIKIILDSHLRTPTNAAVFRRGWVIIAVTKKAPPAKRNKFRSQPAEIIVTKEKKGRVDLTDLFKKLAAKGIVRVLIEGGGEVIASALAEKLVREIYFFIAPKIIGGKKSVGSVGGKDTVVLNQALSLKHLEFHPIGCDWLAHGVL